MLLNILVLCVVLVSILLVCAWVAGARTTRTTTAAPAAPAAKDQRPLWAQAPMADSIPPRCSAWENEGASLDARLERQAQAGKDRPLPRFVPSPEPPPQRTFHRPLKAKSRNWA
jgi:hypothetical protein